MVGRRGFTLIEMLVVLGIMAVLTAALLTRNSAFGGSIILRSLAYDVALSIREAQVYGIAVRQSIAGTFTRGYGVNVRSASPASYLLFSDLDDNGHYSGEGELVTRYTLKNGYKISDICITRATGEEQCSVQKADVTFQRPEPDAYIRQDDTATLNQRVRIRIASPGGSTADVLVEATGQISVQ